MPDKSRDCKIIKENTGKVCLAKRETSFLTLELSVPDWSQDVAKLLKNTILTAEFIHGETIFKCGIILAL